MLLLLFIWGTVVGLIGYGKLQNITNPRYFNHSRLYNCHAVDAQWGKCTSIKYKASFEYPLKWSYIDVPKQGIGFNGQTNDPDEWLVSLDPAEWENDRAKQSLSHATGNKETSINGFWAVSYESKNPQNDIFIKSVRILDNNVVYAFGEWESAVSKRKFSAAELDEIDKYFDHMVNSFRVEK